MLLDAARHDTASPLRADVCIVGAGPAGLTLARELAARGHRVCLLESGGERDAPATQALLEGRSEGTAMPPLDESRLACLGGTTAVWAGWCRPLDPLELAERDWVPHSGWPFEAAHLEPYYRRAQIVCGLGPFEYSTEAWTRPGCAPLQLGDSPVATSVFQFSPPLRFGPAHRAALVAASNIIVLLHATVIGFDTGDGGFAVTGVRVATPRGELRVEASVVVLAAGGIENARLLLLSGLGNQRDLVGRFFMEHPYVASGLLHPTGAGRETAFYHRHQVGGARISGVFTLREELIRRERLVNAAIFLRARGQGHPATEHEAVRSLEVLAAALRRGAVPPRAGRRLATALARPDRLAFAVALRLGLIGGGPIRLRAFTEPVPDPANRVTLSNERDRLGRPRVRVVWRMSELERRSLARIHELLDRALRDRGLGGLELRAAEPAGVGHHMGTTRMHRDPARGVVDEHCRVHGVANLFLAGSSVFPAAGLANPTLTIVALALRLGDRVDQSLRAGVPGARSG